MVSEAASQQSGQISTVITLLIIGAIVSIRLRRMTNGVKVSAGRTMGYLVGLGALSVLFVGESFYTVGISPLFAIPYLATAAGSAYFGHKHSKSSLTFWKDSASTSIFVKGGIAMFAVYIAAMIARLAISFLFVGSFFNPLGGASISQLSPAAYPASVVTDFLMMFGVGLFIGRNISIYQQYSMIKKGQATIPEH